MSDPLGKLKEWRQVTDAATEGPWPVNGSRFGEVGQVWGLNWRDDVQFADVARTAMPLLLTAIENILKLTGAWRARGEHLMKYSNGPEVPGEIGDVLLGDGADFVVKAELVEKAIRDALGGAK